MKNINKVVLASIGAVSLLLTGASASQGYGHSSNGKQNYKDLVANHKEIAFALPTPKPTPKPSPKPTPKPSPKPTPKPTPKPSEAPDPRS